VGLDEVEHALLVLRLDAVFHLTTVTESVTNVSHSRQPTVTQSVTHLSHSRQPTVTQSVTQLSRVRGGGESEGLDWSASE
jgi:hypothetical protein